MNTEQSGHILMFLQSLESPNWDKHPLIYDDVYFL